MASTEQTRKSVYLANPYGFSAQQRELLLPPLIEAVAALGLDVWEPFTRSGGKIDRRSRAGRMTSGSFATRMYGMRTRYLPWSTACRRTRV